MIRILIFILGAAVVAGLITWFASMNTQISAIAFDQRFSIHTGFFLGAALVFLGALVWGVSFYKDVRALPERMKARQIEARLNKGILALTRGYEAIAMGEAGAAQQHARLAQKHLSDPSMTRLLAAQAAQMAGDEKTAQQSFTAMLEAPETEFLGLRGLFLQAAAKGDRQAAHGYAERAFALRSDAAWAFQSVVDLGLDRGAWGETRDIVVSARKNGVIDAEKAQRAEAALLAADAWAAHASGENALALEEAEASLKLAPGFAPAAALAARLHAAAGRTPKAAKILETAFEASPHPALAADHDALFRSEGAERRAAQMRRLADRRQGAREARLVEAARHLVLGEYDGARGILEPLLREAAGARECALMAEAVAGAAGEDAETHAKAWLRRAASAPRDPTPGADGSFQFTRDGWARIIREFMDYARLAPPPLDGAAKGLTEDELRLLAPPATATQPDAAAELPSPDSVAPVAATDVAPSTAAPAPVSAPALSLEQEAEARARAVAAAGQVS